MWTGDGLTMEAQDHQPIEVEEVTLEDIEAGVREDLGMTLDELRHEAAQGRFSSEHARLTWHVLSGTGAVSLNGHGQSR